MENIKQQIVRQKLTIIKKLVTKDKNGDTFIIVNREKNREFILEYGLLIDDIKNIILDLEVDDYYIGLKKMKLVLKGKYGFLLLILGIKDCILKLD